MGYSLIFDEQGPPLLARSPLFPDRPSSHQIEEALSQETKKLLEKDTIEVVVKDPSSPGYYSHLFLVDKRDGGSRLGIGLSTLST